jgi:asparagine synthase (glutamine-hydrolysing)
MGRSVSGIAGEFHLDGSPVAREPLEKVVGFLGRVGPAGSSLWVNGLIGLGHTRFPTTRESLGESLPSSLDGEVWITADARVDGRNELVEALRAAGRTPSLERPDAELILHAYAAWGDACLERLIGDYSFILWDGRQRRLLAARDRFAMRSLYYAQVGSTLLLSNWHEALLAHPAVPRDWSEFGVGSFLALGSVNFLDPSITAYAAIRKLRPAECLVASANGIQVRRYWQCPLEVTPFRYRRKEEVIERFNQLFTRAIQDRLRAPRVAIALSGGMDSTAVAAMTMRVIRAQGLGPQVVALTQRHERINRTDEAGLATRLASSLNIPLHYLEMDTLPWLTPEYRPEDLRFYPLAAQMPPFQRALAALAPVMFTGSSGDMMRTATLSEGVRAQGLPSALAGYIQAWRAHGIRPELNIGVQRLINRARGHQPGYARLFPEWLDTDLEHKYRFRDAFEANPLPVLTGPTNPHHPTLHFWSTLKDNATIWNGHWFDAPVESLDPLGDYRLFHFYLSLHALPWFANKLLLREAMRGLLPDQIRLRPRHEVDGHHPPFLRDKRAQWVDSWAGNELLRPYLRRDAVPKLCGVPVPAHASRVHLRPLWLKLWSDKSPPA